MKSYDSLNLPELMELLHGPAMPDPISWAPATPGWWIVLAWLTGVTAVLLQALVASRRRNAYRRRAAAELQLIESRTRAESRAAIAELAVVLKRTALAAYPRQRVASLYGDAWARFLIESSGDDVAVAAAADKLARAAYGDAADLSELLPAARRWIRVHRV